jgi:histidine ammonia-lyase
MGWGAARKLRTVVANLGRILAVELTCAARALDFRAPLDPGPGTAAARSALRTVVPGAGPDRRLAPELADAEALVASGAVVEAVEDAIGALE